jgi:RHS repeat-associated protein
VRSYDLANQQGTSTESVNAYTLAITRRYYDPYGHAVGTPPAWPDNTAYVSQPRDITTGLGLLGAREYNPPTGSFTSLDPVFEAGDPPDMGGYSYAASNPLPGPTPPGSTPRTRPAATRPTRRSSTRSTTARDQLQRRHQLRQQHRQLE